MLHVKILHIVLVTSWFAGLFYLPRIFVNLALDAQLDVQNRLIIMAKKLYRFTFLLAHLATLSGLWLWYVSGYKQGWVHAKLALVVLLWVYQFFCRRYLKQFEEKRNTHTHVYYRWFNEVPVLILVLLIYLVVAKPF